MVGISVVAISWLSVLLRDQRVGQAAFERLEQHPHLPAVGFAREMKHLDDAGFLNPDSKWELYRGAFLVGRSPRRAVRVIESVLRREPENLGAWVALVNATETVDKRRQAQALARIRRLNPVGQRRRGR
jgi:hypothetical protein